MSRISQTMTNNDKPTEFKKTVGRNAAWSFMQTITSALTVFVLYKYLYGFLGPEQLGLWAVVLASVSLGRLAELGFSTTVLRFISMHLSKGDKRHAAKILETGLISIGAPFAFFLLVLYPFAAELMQQVVPVASLEAAREILPYSFCTLWFGVVGSIVQSALDGCGRMDVKSRMLIIGNLVYVPLAIVLVLQSGIVGLAIGQLLQSILVGVLLWIATRRELPTLGWVPLGWDKACLREILGYAAGLQLGNLLLMLFEPATKILLSRFCGLHEVAHFEMANQVVSRVRALITSAIQAYLPVISSSATNPISARQVVGESTIFIAGMGLPILAALVVSFPVISILWIGHLQVDFIAYGWILGIGWLIATLAMPVYYYCVGAGRVRTVLISQALMVGLNALLGFGAAMSGLGRWVAVSMMTSLAIGNWAVARQTLMDLQLTWQQVFLNANARDVIMTVAMVFVVLVINVSFSVATSLDHYVFANFAVHALLLLLIAYFSDARKVLMGRLRGSR